MASRTNEEAVKRVLDTALTSEQVEQFIEDAGLWVTEELAASGLSADRLELIERYLACALIRTRDLGLKSVDFDDVREQYQVDANVTDYLLRAASFDSTGAVRLAFLTKPDSGRQVVRYRVGTSFTDETVEDAD